MIISLVIFFLFLLLFVPHSIHINLNFTCDNLFTNISLSENYENSVGIKLFKLLTIYKKKLFKKKTNKKSKNKKNKFFENINKFSVIKKLLKKIKYDKFVLSLGFNTTDYVSNSYINASLNTLLCMYINKYQHQFNIKRLYYQTYVAKHLVVLNFESIISISIADTTYIVLKEYFKHKKEKKMLVFERSKYYGNTSN